MRNTYYHDRMNLVARIMAGLGSLGALAVVALRVWVSPSQRDIDTGLFSTNLPVIGLLLFLLLMLGCGVFITRGGFRQEIVGKSSLALAVTLLTAGTAMVLFAAAELLARFGVITFYTVTAVDPEAATLVKVLPWLQTAFCLLGGVAFVRLGLMLASEGATRRGMARWSLLTPVLWMWLVLANYEMSYASMVRLSDGFFTLGMYIMEMLFLFYFARYVSGVGRVGFGTMLFFSAGTALFAVSGPLVRLGMYLLQDGEAYVAAGAAGPLDLLVGLLAVVVSITLCQSLSVVPEEEPDENPEWSDGPDSVSVVDLIEVSADDEGLNEE